MDVICAINTANSILNRSFKEKIGITNLKLNYLLYLLYGEYSYNAKKILFCSNFIKTKYGPLDESVYCLFESYKGNIITDYAYDSLGSAKGVNGYEFDECLSIIWNKYKNCDEQEILSIIEDGKEYEKCNRYDVITEQDILIDEISKKEEMLENAKKYIKKLNRGDIYGCKRNI